MKRSLNFIRREFLLALSYPFFLIVVFIMLLIPRRLRIFLSDKLTKIIPQKNSRAYRHAYNNLRSSFPEKTDADIEKMAEESVRSVMRSMFDFFSSCFLINNKRFFSMVEIEGEEHLKAAHAKGKGVICLVPHLSAWEISAVTPPMLGYKTYAASKKIKGFLYNMTMIFLRRRRGMINFSRNGSYSKLLEVLNNGHCLIIMADQDTMVRGEFIPFFGRPAYTPIGVARMSLDTNAAVVPMATTRKDDGNYKFTIYPALETITTGDYEKDCIANTEIHSKEYERIIRLTPTQWVWMHKRWKTTPESLAKYLAEKKKKRLKKK